MKRLIDSNSFPEKLSEVKWEAWARFASLIKSFLRNHKAENYRGIVGELVET